MRSLPFSATSPTGLAKCITILRGTTAIRFTTHHSEITLDGHTFAPAEGCTVSNIQFPSDVSPLTAEVSLFASSTGAIAPGEALRGILDGWPISIQYVDIGNTAAGGFDMTPAATTGQVTEDGDGRVVIPVNGPLAQTRGPLTSHFSLLCRHTLGDDGCKVPILPAEIQRNTPYVTTGVSGGLQAVNDCYGRVATGVAGNVEDYANVFYECTTAGTTAATAPTYDPTVGNTTTDGSAVFTARNAWLRYAYGQRTGDYTIVLTALPDPRATDDELYIRGGLYIRSGPLAGFAPREIRAWDHSTLTLTMAEAIGANDIPASTEMEIFPGCRKTQADCFGRFNNIVNRAAEDFVPIDSNLGLI